MKKCTETNAVGIYNKSCDSDNMMELAMRESSSDESLRCSKRSVEVRSEAPPSEEQQQQLPPPEDTPPTAPKAKKTGRTKQTQPQPIKSQQKTKNSQKSENTAVKKKPKRTRKRPPCNGPSELFSPREPEINLKVLRLQEEKKKKEKKKSANFCPFVRKEATRCTVFNFQQQEDEANLSRGKQRGEPAPASRSITSNLLPKTSCFELGCAPPDLSSPDSLQCCLCGQTANITNLGDLYGPYRPVAPQEPCPYSRGKQSPSADGSCSRPQPPPPAESWVHEDCSVWCTGVLLVRGRLYGLQEAALLTQETVCWSCRQTGAIIGCLQKGCSSCYHYSCAVQSGCSLIEENFSMKCPKHKF